MLSIKKKTFYTAGPAEAHIKIFAIIQYMPLKFSKKSSVNVTYPATLLPILGTVIGKLIVIKKN